MSRVQVRVEIECDDPAVVELYAAKVEQLLQQLSKRPPTFVIQATDPGAGKVLRKLAQPVPAAIVREDTSWRDKPFRCEQHQLGWDRAQGLGAHNRHNHPKTPGAASATAAEPKATDPSPPVPGNTPPVFGEVLTCACGHAPRRHEDGDGPCSLCDCTRLRETA